MSHVPPPTPTFEKDRIRALKNERINSQKKTFTKWVNSFLDKVSALHALRLLTRIQFTAPSLKKTSLFLLLSVKIKMII